MPAIKPLSDFVRSPGSMIDELRETQEPIYLTKNGSSSIVVMDAAAYDRQMRHLEMQREREMRAYEGLVAGYEDMVCGRVSVAGDVFDAIEKEKGWS